MNVLTPDFGIIFWQTLTFLTVLWILSKYAWQPILTAMRIRENAIAQAIHQIAEAKALIEKANTDRATLLKEAKLEREQILTIALETQREIIDRAHKDGLQIKAHLLTESKVEIAKQEAQSLEAVSAKIRLIAIQMAEQLLIKELSQDQSQLEFLERLTTHESSATY